MQRIQEEANAPNWADDILELCKMNPMYFMAFRSYALLETYDEVVNTPVPFVHKYWFIPLFFVYVVGKFLVGVVLPKDTHVSGHVFCCTSTSSYRSDSFFDLVEFFDNSRTSATLYCTSDCQRKYQDQDRKSANIATIGSTFRNISPFAFFRGIPDLWRVNMMMAKLLEVERFRWKVVVFNVLLAEHVKYLGLRSSIREVKSFHTYSPMPYQLLAVENTRIFTHQHGIQATSGNRAMAIPKFAPVNYLVYGAFWVDNFSRKAHPESNIYPVGNPRFDRLVERRTERSSEIDLLFVSGSHILDRSDFDECEYRELVESVVGICSDQGWKLVIKLHPIEGPEYYESWGYEEYITDEDDIIDLLLCSDVAVTDVSTAFLESILVGTPMVVTQHTDMDLGLDGIDDIEGLTFPESLTQARKDILRLKGSIVSEAAISSSSIMEIGDTEARIERVVTATS